MKINKYVTVFLAVAAMAATFISCDRSNDITGNPMEQKPAYWIDFSLSNAGTLNDEAKTVFTQKIAEIIYPSDWALGVREIKTIEHPMYVSESYARNSFNAVKAIPAEESDIVQKIMIPTAKVQKVVDFAVTMTLSKDSMKTVLDTYTWNASSVISAEDLN